MTTGAGGVVYALIARRRDVLCEYTDGNISGNFPTVTRVLLQKLPVADGRACYIYDESQFSYIVDEGITFLCMASQSFKARLSFSFLEDVKERWRARFGAVENTALAFSLDDAFRPVLKDRMEYWSNSNGDNLSALQNKIDSVKETMTQNIDRILDRGDRIELLVTKTDKLQEQAFFFNRQAKNLKHQLWCRSFRTKLLFITVVLVVVAATVAVVCGLSLGKCIKQ